MSKPLLSCVKLLSLVGEVLTAVTMDSVVYTVNMGQEEQVVGRRRRGLKVRNKGDILERIVEESKTIGTIGQATPEMQEHLLQLRIFQVQGQPPLPTSHLEINQPGIKSIKNSSDFSVNSDSHHL